MSLWICRGCTAAYAVGAPACPQCGSTEYVEDWNMPKISKGGGVSYAPGTEPEHTVDQGPAEQAPPTPAETEQSAPGPDAKTDTPPPAPAK